MWKLPQAHASVQSIKSHSDCLVILSGVWPEFGQTQSKAPHFEDLNSLNTLPRRRHITPQK